MNNVNKKILKIVGILIISGGMIFVNAFLGNPISKTIANKSSNKYIKQNYSRLNLEKEKTFYSFKDGNYHVVVQSKDSIDTNFDIYINSIGKVEGDTYSSINFNTWVRLDKEVGEKISPVFKSQLNYDIENIRVGLSSNTMDESLELDMKLDIYNPPIPYEIHAGIYTDDLSYEKIAEIALDIEKIMNKEKLPIKYMSFVLIPTSNREEEGRAISWNNALTAFDIPVEILKSDDIVQGIKEYNEDQYEELDKNVYRKGSKIYPIY